MKKYNTDVIQSISNQVDVSADYVRKCIRNTDIVNNKARVIRDLYHHRVNKINQELNL